MNLEEGIAQAKAWGFGINFGHNPERQVFGWSCAIFGGYGKLGFRSYACKQADSMAEALALCLSEVQQGYQEVRPSHSSINKAELDSLLAELDLT